MAEISKFENLLLDPKDYEKQERTFLGGFRLRARSNLFRFLGFASLILLGAIFFRIDQHVSNVVDDWRASHELFMLTSSTQLGIARAEMLERTYFLDQKKNLTEAFLNELARVDSTLSKIYSVPQAAPVRQKVATLRDGIDQYSRAFTKFVADDDAIPYVYRTGLSPKLRKLTTKLSQGFEKEGLSMLVENLARIMGQGDNIILSNSRSGLSVIQKSYDTLFRLLNTSKTTDAKKSEFVKLLKSHQAHLIKLTNSRFVQETKRRQLSEILTYISSSATALSRFAYNLNVSAVRQLDQTRYHARYTLAGATAAIVLWFMFAGILLFRSVVNPIQALAFTINKIAMGERNVRIPARGNADASGQIARALGKWVEDLADADMVRNELEDVREKLELTISGAEGRVEAAAESAQAALHLEQDRLERSLEEKAAKEMVSPGSDDFGLIPEVESFEPPVENKSGDGPIRYASQQLTHFSDYVTAAAHDVERTESLIRNLNEVNSHLESFGKLISVVQEQVKVLILHSSSPGSLSNVPQKSFPNSGSDRGYTDHVIFREPEGVKHLNEIQVSTDQAKRRLGSIGVVMKVINAIAQDIAKTASDQALEATNKLLSQSHQLQQMLDDIMAKINIESTNNRFSSKSEVENDLAEYSNKNTEKN